MKKETLVITTSYKGEKVTTSYDGEYNREWIYEQLAKDLIAKKMHHCRYITRITERSNYDGTREITVYHDNGTRKVYTIVF